MMTIGQLSTMTGIPASTLRFWERKGILDPPARNGGQRRYTDNALNEVAILKLCQDAGFTLEEIGNIPPSRGDNPQWRALVLHKLAEIDARMQRLAQAHRLLDHTLVCEYPDIADCPKFHEAVARRRHLPAQPNPGARSTGLG